MLETGHSGSEKPTRAQSATTASFSVDGRTLPEAFTRRVEMSPDKTVFLTKEQGTYEPTTWQQAGEQVWQICSLLKDLKLKKGQAVGIFSESRKEWTMADLGIQFAGLVTVPVYHSSSEEDLQFITENCDMQACFVETQRMAKHLRQAAKNKKLLIFVFDSKKKGEEATLADAVPTASKSFLEDLKTQSARISGSDIASIVYTSGTTGVPKGAVLTHANFLAGLRDVVDYVEFNEHDVSLAFLPFAHVLGRVEALSPVICGMATAFAENIATISKNIQEVRPTILVSVPRIYEKIYAKITAQFDRESEYKKRLAYWAVDVGRRVARLRSENQPIPIRLQLKFQVATQLVLSKIYDKLGGRLRISATGGAPISPELCEFFHGCGIKILEGYGLTETLGPIVANHPKNFRFGTVGKPMRNAEIKIAQDGEILLKGASVFKGYHKNKKATEEAFDKDGWLRTGDIGELDDRGFLKITDRKKELIVTSGGKNIAPQKIENLIKMSKYISNCIVYGDKQKFLTCLITLDEEQIRPWAKETGKDSDPQGADIKKLIATEVARANAGLATYESIKKFSVLQHDFAIESGELTPSLKLKRKVILAKYESDLLDLYK